MTPLTSMLDQLAVSLTADPLTLLASAVATFDPFWAAFDEDEIDYEHDPLTVALQVTRGAFPDVYADAVQHLGAGASYQEMDRLLCRAISAKGIPLDDLEMIGWGIPLTAVGVDLEDPNFYAAHPDLLPMLRCFGMSASDEDAYCAVLPDNLYPVGRAIAASLLEEAEPTLRQVGWLFGWLFSCTGNSLVDYTDEALAEIPPLSWSAEDVAFAVELIEEANGIMQDAQAGLDILNILKASPDLYAALERNIANLYRALKKGKPSEQTIRLDWSDAVGRADRAAIPGNEFLLVRDHAA